jgi:hypothetical protein
MKNTIIASLALVASAGLSWGGAPAKMYNVTQAPLASKEVQAKTDDVLKAVILKGQGKMKPVSGITEKQAADVVAFVRTLK